MFPGQIMKKDDAGGDRISPPLYFRTEAHRDAFLALPFWDSTFIPEPDDNAYALPAAGRPALTIHDASVLGEIARAVEGKVKIARARPDGNVVIGIVRMVNESAERPFFPGPDVDVRDCCLWITPVKGGIFEQWWPIAELVEEIRTGRCVLDYQE